MVRRFVKGYGEVETDYYSYFLVGSTLKLVPDMGDPAFPVEG